MTYKHLTIHERCSIALYLSDGIPVKKIANLLQRNESTIRREIKRNSDSGVYVGAQAQEKAEKRYSSLKNASKLTKDLRLKILEKLEQDWSPEQIRGYFLRFEKTFISFKAIYNWIRQGMFGNVTSHLRRAGKKYKRKTDVNIMKGGTSIHDRMEAANERSEIGHWELDTVVGPLGTKSAIVTAVDRMTRLSIVRKVENRTSQNVTEAILFMLNHHPVKSLTFDNGKEFSNHEHLSLFFSVPCYFADPRSPWQRGTNENTNGLIRQYFPKGTVFDYINDDDIEKVVDLINSRPRKIFKYQSAQEIFNL